MKFCAGLLTGLKNSVSVALHSFIQGLDVPTCKVGLSVAIWKMLRMFR